MNTEQRKKQFEKDCSKPLPESYQKELKQMEEQAEYVTRRFLAK